MHDETRPVESGGNENDIEGKESERLNHGVTQACTAIGTEDLFIELYGGRPDPPVPRSFRLCERSCAEYQNA